MKEILEVVDEPLVLATSHLDSPGRRQFAQLAGSNGKMSCSVTHSLYLPDQEVRFLADLGAVFEADLYTMFNRVRSSPLAALAGRAELCSGAPLVALPDLGCRPGGYR